MGTFVFKWPHAATEVFVTGTFDDWSKSEKLEKKGDIFEKEVTLKNADKKILYKFVVDDKWTTDHTAPQEDDGHSNVNNVLHPEGINTSGASAMVSGVTPASTTAGLAGEVPKEGAGVATISSAAPESTSAELAKEVPLEKKETSGSSGLPGTFPETPAGEPESFSVNPIPASSGIGNPVQLAPGEKVPDPSTINSNTVDSTATTDQETYEKGADAVPTEISKKEEDSGAFSVPEQSKNLIPESSLPISEPGSKGPDTTDTGPTIQSAAPESSTAALAGEVPKEPRGVATTETPAAEESKPTEPESKKEEGGVLAAGGAAVAAGGAATVAAVSSKSEEPTTVASDVPEAVKESIAEAHASPEAAGNETAVEEKKEVEAQLLKEVKEEESAGEPAPTESASTTLKAPDAPARAQSRDLSPHSRPSQPSTNLAAAATETTTPTSAATTPSKPTPESTPSKDKKNKRRSFFGKLKDKLKG